ncbi:MAG: group III truncated hemoglobin [Maribacter sp.]
MGKQDLKNRKDVYRLVERFYERIRADITLGPIFDGIITDWPAHLEHLTDFWESQLFVKRKYLGNPITVHQEVDEKTGYTITSAHFGLWLNLWFSTIDGLFSGEMAWIAKNRAQKMSTMLFMQMYQHRKR